MKELEPEPKVSNEVQDSQVPSQGDPTPNSVEGESSQVPSEAPPLAAPQDANVLMSRVLEKMADLVGILTTYLKPNETAASGSTGGQGSKRVVD